MAIFYDYENRTAFNPETGEGTPNAVGQVYAKTDTTFSTPLVVTLMGSGLSVTDLTTDQYCQLQGFQAADHLQVVFKSGDFTKVLNTTTPLVGPAGPAVADAVDNGDGTVTFLLEDGSPAATVELPVAPGGSDSGVASYVETPGTDTRKMLDAGYVQKITAPKDGVTSAVAAIRDAIAAANGSPLELPPGDYLIDASITSSVPVNLRLATGARILNAANTPAIEFLGGGSGNSRGLYAPAVAAQNIVQCSTADLAVGDWIILRHPDVFPGATRGTRYGELHRIRQIDGSGQLRTIANLDYSYPQTTAAVVKFNMIEGVKILGGEFVNTIGATLKVPMVRLTACADVEVDVSVRGAGGPGVTISGCTLFDVKARVRESIDDEAGGNFGYGVEVFGASCHGKVYVDMVGGRHAFTTTSGATTFGVPRHITVSGIAEGVTNTGWDTHEEGDHIHFHNVVASGCRNAGVKHRAPNSTIINPTITNTRGIGVRFAPTATGGVLSGGNIQTTYLSDGSPGTGVSIEANDVTVTGDPIFQSEDMGIRVLTGANRSDIRSAKITAGLRNNAATAYGINYQGTSTGHRLGRNVTITAASPVVKDAGVAVHAAGPRKFDLGVLGAEVSQTGWTDVQQNNAYWFGARRLSSGAQNDQVVFIEELPFGAYTLNLFHDTSSTRGIYEVSSARVIDGVIGTYTVVGTVDGYEATNGRARSSLTVNVNTPGPVAFRIRMASKHASATAYYGSLSAATLTRQ